MSNFKLTDEAKQVLIKALAFCDDESVKQNRDTLIQRIRDGEINDTDELTSYYCYIKIAIDSHKEYLKRAISDGKILSEDVDSERKELQFCNEVLTLLKSNFTNNFTI